MQIRLTSVKHGGATVEVNDMQPIHANKIYVNEEGRLYKVVEANGYDFFNKRNEIVMEEIWPIQLEGKVKR